MTVHVNAGRRHRVHQGEHEQHDEEHDEQDLVLAKSVPVYPDKDTECTKYCKNRTRCAHFHGIRPHYSAGQISTDATQQYQKHVTLFLFHFNLYYKSDHKQGKGVPEEMQDAIVDENGCDESPHLILVHDCICIFSSEVVFNADPIILRSHNAD